MKIEKRFDFLAHFANKEIDLNKIDPQARRALEAEGVTLAQLRNLDRDGNGKITNENEVKALFGLINKHDTDDKAWTIVAQDSSGRTTKAGRLHNILSLQFEEARGSSSSTHSVPSRPSPGGSIRRSDFLNQFAGKELVLSSLGDSDRNTLWGAGEATTFGLKSADLDGDGKISTREEFAALFTYIDKFDNDGRSSSLSLKDSSGRPTNPGKILDLLHRKMEVSTTSPSRPTGSTGSTTPSTHSVPSRPSSDGSIHRSDFLNQFAGKELVLSSLGDSDRNTLWGAGEATTFGLKSADLDGDGKISTREEFAALFTYIDKFDNDGRSSSLSLKDSSGRPTNPGKILDLLRRKMGVSTTSPSRPTGSTTPTTPTIPSPSTPASLPNRLMGYFDSLGGQIRGNEISGSALRSIIGNKMLSMNDVTGLFGRYKGKCPTDSDKSALLDALGEYISVRPGSPDARTLASLRIDAVHGDGKIQGGELQRAERAMMNAGLTRDQAVDALTSNLGRHLFGQMDVSAIDYIRSGWGSMEGQVRIFEDLFAERATRAKVIDANFDGKLGAGDLRAIVNPNGSIRLETIGDTQAKEILIGQAISNAAREMGKAGHEFNLLEQQHANPRFFDMTKHKDWDSNSTFKLKPGVRASDAMNDIFNNPDAYGFECATAMVIVHYRALQELLGDQDFDRVCGDLRIGAWDTEGDLKSLNKFYRSPEAKHIKTGDYTYIKNWDVSEEGEKGGWQGENVINLGNGLFYGHPFGVASADEIVKYLNTQRNPDSTRSASRLEDTRMTLDPSLFRLDRNPND